MFTFYNVHNCCNCHCFWPLKIKCMFWYSILHSYIQVAYHNNLAFKSNFEWAYIWRGLYLEGERFIFGMFITLSGIGIQHKYALHEQKLRTSQKKISFLMNSFFIHTLILFSILFWEGELQFIWRGSPYIWNFMV